MLRLILLTALFLSPAFVSHAAPDLADEARLRGVVERLITGQKTAFEKTGGTFVTTGETMIEAAGTYYAVTLPEITLVHPNKARTALGLISLNAAPAGTGRWNITMALPTPIVTRDSDGKMQSELMLGKQYFTGLWDEKFQNFTSLKTLYQNATLKFAQNTPQSPFNSATIKKMGYGFDLADTTQKKTDLAFRFGIEGLVAQGLNPAHARLFPSDAGVDIVFKDLPMDKLGEIQKDLLAPDKMASSPLWITELLGKTGSEAIINSLQLQNKDAALNLTGTLKPAPETPLKHTGNLVLDIARIDQILLGLNETAATLPAKEQGKLQGIRVALTMMSALGENVDASSVATKRYNVELKENGQIIMNGTDFSALLGGIAKTEETKATR